MCFNPEQAQRDAVTRTAILDSLRMKLQRRGRGISTSASSENAFRLATYKRRAYAALQQRKGGSPNEHQSKRPNEAGLDQKEAVHPIRRAPAPPG